MSDRDADIAAFVQAHGWQEAQRVTIAGDASNRRYERLTHADGRRAVLMDAPPDKGEDTGPFVQIAGWLRDAGLSAPQIYAQDAQKGLLLLEDFGDALFANLMAQDSTQTAPLYQIATDVLLHLRQVTPPPSLPVCDAAWLVDMLAPLFDWYAPNTAPAQRTTIEAAFAPLAAQVDAQGKVLMLRDYHVENLLLLSERSGVAQAGLLDFQDAMLGHPAYDLVSILQDARRDVAPEIEAQFIRYYLDNAPLEAQLETERFRRDYAVLGLQRNLRIVGIFARLSRRDGKPHYVDMIPRVWGYAMRNLRHPELADLEALITAALPQPTPTLLTELKIPCPT